MNWRCGCFHLTWYWLNDEARLSVLRILMIVFNQTGAGTYWRAFQFGRSLAQRGHAVTLMATSPAARMHLHKQELDGIQLVETPDLLSGSLRSGWDAWNTLQRILWLRNKSFDIVHAFECRPVVIFPALAAQRHGAKLLLDWADWFGRGGSVEERPNPFVRTILRPVETYFENHYRSHSDGTTVINLFLRERAIQLGVNPETILLLRNGSDTSVPLTEQSAARKLLGLPQGKPLIGFVGRTYLQDAKFMARAFDLLIDTVPNAKLLLVGYFNRDIEGLTKTPSSIIRTGPVKSGQLHQYLSACDLCWLPLTDTGANRGRWPLKLNNYMSAGRPIIATDVGDLRQVISQYNLGVVTPPDPSSFSVQTAALLSDAELRQSLGQAAREAAEGIFSWARLTDELETFYRRVLSED